MRTQILLLLAAGSLAVSCTTVRESRINPFNWFGSDRPVRVSAGEGLVAPLPDARPLVDQVLDVTVTRTPSGAVVQARGLPPTQGYYDAALVALNRGRAVDGVLQYEFRAAPPLAPAPQGAQASREVLVSADISNARLQSVQVIEVIGGRNRQTIRRR